MFSRNGAFATFVSVIKAVSIINAGISELAIRKMCREIQNMQHLLEKEGKKKNMKWNYNPTIAICREHRE